MVTPVRATAGPAFAALRRGKSVMSDFKAAEGWGVCQGRLAVFSDVAAELAVKDRGEKGAHFLLFARREKLDAAIGQIAH